MVMYRPVQAPGRIRDVHTGNPSCSSFSYGVRLLGSPSSSQREEVEGSKPCQRESWVASDDVMALETK